MWTRLMAGATAHEINNLTQGLLNLLTLAAQPGATVGTLDRMAAVARERLAVFERLSRELAVLARSGDPAARRPQRLDLIVSDAVTETELLGGRSVVVDDPPSGVWVGGPADALRTAIRGLLAHGLAATPPGGAIRVGVTTDPDSVIVTIDVPSAASEHERGARGALVPVASVEAGHELHGDFSVMLAGALAVELGGELRAGVGAATRLRFALSLPRAEAPEQLA